MRRIIAFLCASILSVSASAFLDEAKFYSGKGRWSSIDGKGGEYRVSVLAKPTAGGMRLENHYIIEGRSYDIAFDIVPTQLETEGKFFDVHFDDEAVGNGYCFELSLGRKVCSMEVEIGGAHIEQSVMVSHTKVHRLGSKTAGDTKIVWRESLRRRPLKD